MANTIDYLLQDSNAALSAVEANRPALTEKGFTEAAYTGFVEARNALKSSEVAQQKAVKTAEDKTAIQNAVMQEVTELLKSVRNAAKSAFGKDERILKQFKIGEKIPGTVKKLSTTCEYMVTVVEDKKTDLLQSGLVQADLDNLTSAKERLESSDAEQERAKKLQESATIVRDKAAEVMKAKLDSLRNFVAAAFAKKPEIAVQFKPIPKGRGGKGKPDTPPEDTTPPDTPTPPAQ